MRFEVLTLKTVSADSFETLMPLYQLQGVTYQDILISLTFSKCYDDVETSHNGSSASQSQAMNHPLLSNGWINGRF
jgi:hypothetical protein